MGVFQLRNTVFFYKKNPTVRWDKVDRFRVSDKRLIFNLFVFFFYNLFRVTLFHGMTLGRGFFAHFVFFISSAA